MFLGHWTTEEQLKRSQDISQSLPLTSFPMKRLGRKTAAGETRTETELDCGLDPGEPAAGIRNLETDAQWMRQGSERAQRAEGWGLDSGPAHTCAILPAILQLPSGQAGLSPGLDVTLHLTCLN